MSGMLCHQDSSNYTTGHDDGSGVNYHLDSFIVILDLMSDIYIYIYIYIYISGVNMCA